MTDNSTAEPDTSLNITRRDLWLWVALFALALAVRLVQALQLHFPPLDDPAYYLKTAQNVVAGRGLSNAIIWNYRPLPAFAGLHPAFDYWMPLSSFAMIPCLWLTGGAYVGAQLPSLLAGALLAPMACIFGRRVLPGRVLPLAVGLLVALDPLPVYQSALPDSAMLYAALAAAALLVMSSAASPSLEGKGIEGLGSILAGVLAGLAFLARTPAVFVLAAWLLGIVLARGERRRAARLVLVALLGFGVVVAPWLLRNVLTFGFATSPAGTQTLFITDYSDLFAYGGPTTPGGLVAQAGGVGALVAERGAALAGMWASLGTFFWPSALLPVAGALLLWRQPAARVPLVYCLLLCLGLPLIFGVASENGSFYHSAASMTPFLAPATVWAVYRGGAFVGRFIGPRRTASRRARQLGGALVAALLLLNAALLPPTIAATVARHTAEQEQYRRVAVWLHDHPAPVIVGNEPSTLNYVSDSPALRLPANQDAATLRRLMARYGATYVIITARVGLYPAALQSSPLFRAVYTDGGDAATGADGFVVFAPV